jgi:septum formation protein
MNVTPAQPVPLVLASASPRRREILGVLGLSFRVVPSDVDESRRAGEPALEWVRRAARDKAEDVASRLASESPPPFVLGADTVVVVDGEPLGKPADDADARRMIERLSGRWHEVATAVVVARAGEGVLDERTVVTGVRFRAVDPREVEGYVASGEGRDKAGAYAVQGLGSALVTEIRGSYLNVVGLPAAETLLALRSVGAVEAWP